MMAGRRSRSGVCIIRFEPEPDRWLVSVSLIWPLSHDNRMSAHEKVRYFSDPELAIAAIGERLREAFSSSPVHEVELSITNPMSASSQGIQRSAQSDE